MALDNFKCNHLMPLHFTGLTAKFVFVYASVRDVSSRCQDGTRSLFDVCFPYTASNGAQPATPFHRYRPQSDPSAGRWRCHGIRRCSAAASWLGKDSRCGRLGELRPPCWVGRTSERMAWSVGRWLSSRLNVRSVISVGLRRAPLSRVPLLPSPIGHC